MILLMKGGPMPPTQPHTRRIAVFPTAIILQGDTLPPTIESQIIIAPQIDYWGLHGAYALIIAPELDVLGHRPEPPLSSRPRTVSSSGEPETEERFGTLEIHHTLHLHQSIWFFRDTKHFSLLFYEKPDEQHPLPA